LRTIWRLFGHGRGGWDATSAFCRAQAPTWQHRSVIPYPSVFQGADKFGTGHPEGLVEAGASNNASLASGWVPSLLSGIPGGTITAIAIGVL